MRKLFGLLAVAAMVVGVGGKATAAPVFTTASLEVAITGFGSITAFGSGSVDVSGSTVTVPGGLVVLGSNVTVPVTTSTVLSSVIAVAGIQNASGTFSAGGAPSTFTCTAPAMPVPGPNGTGQACVTGGGVGGQMAVSGTIVAGKVLGLVNVPLGLNALGVGQGGSTTAPLGVLTLNIDAAPWTTGNGKLFATVEVGTPPNNTTISTTFNTTGSSSPFTLVTPTFISVGGIVLPVVAKLTLDNVSLVPEPGTLLLLVTGAAGLAVVGRRRK